MEEARKDPGEVVDINDVAMEWYTQSHSGFHQQVGYWSLPSHINPTKVDRVSSLSYDQLTSQILYPFIKEMSTYLRCCKSSQDTTTSANKGYQFHQPVVAICIPEGPFLPIAVLAVHFYNLIDHISDNNNQNCYAKVSPIILPLDPQEGEDRLKHMIQDSQPSFILYVKNTFDGQKIENIINSMYQSGEIKPEMLDVVTLLLYAAETSPSTTNPESLFTQKFAVKQNRISHIVYTSGTTGVPKGTISSINSLLNYIHAKNKSHYISSEGRVFLASSLSFDPCLSDIIATFHVGACLCFCDKEMMKMDLGFILNVLKVSHVLCTPSLWNSVEYKVGSLQSLEVVALGGEVMSGRIKGCWARNKQTTITADNDEKSKRSVKLLSTYGVTEACVYQTVGEVFVKDCESTNIGYDIGFPIDGVHVSICKETSNDTHLHENVLTIVGQGEIVVSGLQVDELSGYLNLPDMTRKKFIKFPIEDNNKSVQYFYRTGDRGLIDPQSGRLRILGRIDGEEGMVKINGVRVELGEIEHSIVDSESFCRSSSSRSLVTGCIAITNKVGVEETIKIIAYCVLSDECIKELGIEYLKNDDQGLICSPGPLMALLRARCDRKLRKECIPSAFVLIPRIPLTRTGKRNRQALPSLEKCHVFTKNGPGCDIEGCVAVRLDMYGRCGRFVYKALIECLNLQPKQQEFVTTTTNFAMLGGDSLAATLIVRSLYALHHKGKISGILNLL